MPRGYIAVLVEWQRDILKAKRENLILGDVKCCLWDRESRERERDGSFDI